MRQRKVKWIAKLLVFAMVLESGMLSSADIVSAKAEGSMPKEGDSQIISPEKITDPYIEKDRNRQSGQEKLAETETKEETEKEWELVVNPKTPMDKVLFYSDNNPEGKGYYYGYKDGKAAVMDEDFQCRTNAEFDGIMTADSDLEDIIIKGKPAVIAYKEIVEEDEDGDTNKNTYYGIMSCTGETLIKPKYKKIKSCRDSGYNELLEITTMAGKKGIYNSKLEELMPCKYDDVSYYDTEDGKFLLYGYDKDTGEAVVILDKKVIWREQVGKDIDGVTIYPGAEYIDKEWIYLHFNSLSDESYFKVITYDGISVTDYISESKCSQIEKEISKKNKEENEQWLLEQSKKDEKEVAAFFKEKGVTLSNIETTRESFTVFGEKYLTYSWVKISAEYVDNRSKNTNAANPGKLLYSLIYNGYRERVIAGRSFCQDLVQNEFGSICNRMECLTLLSNDGKLCYLPQMQREAVTLCKIDEKDGLAYLYVKDQAGSDNSNMPNNGDSRTEPFRLHYEESDVPHVFRYVEERIVDGVLEEKSHEYWNDADVIYSAESIIENCGESYYLVENDDAKIDAYYYEYKDGSCSAHLECSADEMRSKQLKTVEFDFDAYTSDFYPGMCMFCNKHRRVTVITGRNCCQATYDQLDISGNLSDSAFIRVVSDGFLNRYVIGIDDINICVDVDA